jgi:DNA-binding NtrC family response regulator
MFKPLTLKIAADNALIVNGLRHHLQGRFGAELAIECCFDIRACLRSVSRETDAVIIDYSIDGMAAHDVASRIRAINPMAEVIMHTAREQVASAILGLLEKRSLSAAVSLQRFTGELGYVHR